LVCWPLPAGRGNDAGPSRFVQQCRTVPVCATMQDRPGLCNNAGPSRSGAGRVRRWCGGRRARPAPRGARSRAPPR
jgi:hypothetical protein